MRYLTAVVLLLSAPSLLAAIAASHLVIPVAGSIATFDGGHFSTDLAIVNSSHDSVDVDISFLAAGAPPRVDHEQLPFGTSRTFTNVVSTLFGVDNVVGALRVDASAEVVGTNAGATASTRQTVAAIPAELAAGAGEESVLPRVTIDETHRYNVFLVETNGRPVAADLVLTGSDGQPIATQQLSLAANEVRRIDLASLANGGRISNAA